jgi:hypothetical protein
MPALQAQTHCTRHATSGEDAVLMLCGFLKMPGLPASLSPALEQVL